MRISIVTISFNQARFLEQAIRSVIEQDYHDIEYIVVDPGSTDGSREIIERFRPRLARMIFEPDEGPADGLNKGFAVATGDIFGYLNSDDYFEPGAFARVACAFEAKAELDVLCGAIRIVDGSGKARLRSLVADQFDLKRYLAGVCVVGQQATFFRRRAFESSDGFNPDNRTCWDGELLVDFARKGCRFGVIDRVLGNFRIHRDSISGSGRLYDKYLGDQQRILRQLEAGEIAIHPVNRFALRVWHKANPIRHLRSLTVR